MNNTKYNERLKTLLASLRDFYTIYASKTPQESPGGLCLCVSLRRRVLDTEALDVEDKWDRTRFFQRNREDCYLLKDYLDDNLPEGNHKYNWPKADTAARIGWLNKQIEKL